MGNQVIKPTDVHAPRGYNHAVKAGNTVYVAGQVGLDPHGQLVGKGDVKAQAEQVFANLRAVLSSAGASMADVVKLNTFLTRAGDVPSVVEIRRRQFVGEPPATTLVVVPALAHSDYLIEVEAIAVTA